MEAKLECIGPDPLFPGAGNFYQTEDDFRLTEKHGKPGVVEKLLKLEPREDDLFVVSFPKTGTTWLQEISYLIGTSLDFESAKNQHLFDRCPYVDYANCRRTSEQIAEMKSPRFFKLHLPYSSLPKSLIEKGCKLLYPMRNPKDTLVSYFHFCKKNKTFGYTGDFSTFFDLFLDGKVAYGPYWKHCLEFWNRRHHNNVFLTTFEDMKMDLPSVVKKLSKFMDKNLTESQIQSIAKHCGFEEMKKNESINPDKLPNAHEVFLLPEQNSTSFFRKGEVGDWKNYFTDEMNKRMDEHIEKYFTPAGINFVYEI